MPTTGTSANLQSQSSQPVSQQQNQHSQQHADKLDRSKFRDLLADAFGIDDSLIMDRVCFKVYDLNGDRYISKEEMFQLLKNCLVKGTEEDDDGVKDLVDLIMKKLDEDRDGRVSENDWVNSVGKDRLLLEAFGQCLPSNESKKKFLVYSDAEIRIWEEKYKQRPSQLKNKSPAKTKGAAPASASNAKQADASATKKAISKAAQ